MAAVRNSWNKWLNLSIKKRQRERERIVQGLILFVRSSAKLYWLATCRYCQSTIDFIEISAGKRDVHAISLHGVCCSFRMLGRAFQLLSHQIWFLSMSLAFFQFFAACYLFMWFLILAAISPIAICQMPDVISIWHVTQGTRHKYAHRGQVRQTA